MLDLRKPDAIAHALQQAGYKAEIRTDSKGKTYISSAANGQNFSIQFYDCGDDGCNSFQFYTWYKKQDYFSPSLTKDWNAHKRLLKVAIDDYAEIGRSHVSTPVTNAPLVCRLLLDKKPLSHTMHHTFTTHPLPSPYETYI